MLTTAKRMLVPLMALLLLLSGCAGQSAGSAAQKPELWEALVEQGVILSARVLSIESDETYTDDSGETVQLVYFTAELRSGELKGHTVEGRLVVYQFVGYRVSALKAGSRIFLQPILDENEQPLGEFADYDRTVSITVLIVLFAAVLCLVGGRKGVRSLLALALTCASLAFIFIPMIMAGARPVGAALLCCALVSVLTLLIISGANVKTWASLMGVMVGLLAAGLLSGIMQSAMNMTGLIDSEAIRLSQTAGLESLNMNGLMLAAILIGALGAAMDMAMSLASALEELNERAELQGVALIRSGMKMGRDMMGTMTTTLVLAYVGGALHLIMLLAADLSQFAYVVSWELLATEILRALAGSIGLILIVPATSVFAALLYRRRAGDPNPFA